MDRINEGLPDRSIVERPCEGCGGVAVEMRYFRTEPGSGQVFRCVNGHDGPQDDDWVVSGNPAPGFRY
jgi:hypothetical protein